MVSVYSHRMIFADEAALRCAAGADSATALGTAELLLQTVPARRSRAIDSADNLENDRSLPGAAAKNSKSRSFV